MILQSLRLYSADRTAALLSEADTARLVGDLPMRFTYTDPVEITTTSQQFAPNVARLAERVTLRAVYTDADDGTAGGGQTSLRVVRWWRCRFLVESIGDSSLDVVCTWRPLWLDAKEGIAKPADVQVLGDAGTVDLALRIVERPLADALAVLLDPARGAPQTASGAALLTPGVIEGPLQGVVASLTLTNTNTKDAIERLAAGSTPQARYLARVVEGVDAQGAPAPAEDTYAVDFFVPPDPDQPETVPVVTIEMTAGSSNAVRLQRTETDEDAASVVVPTAQGDSESGETSGSLAGNRLAVATVTEPAGVRTLSFETAPLVWEPGALVGLTVEVLASVDADGAPTPLGVGTVVPITASALPTPGAPSGTVTVSGRMDQGVTGVSPSAVRLRRADGGPLVSLESPALVARYGRIERAVALDVAPLANLLAEPGRMPEQADGTSAVSADLSTWTGDPGSPTDGDRPLGVYKTGETGALPTFTRETDAALARFGGASLRVVAPGDGAGHRIDCGPYRADVGAWAGVHLLSGTVALRLSQRDPARGREVTVIEAEGKAVDGLVTFSELAVAVTADNFPAAPDAGPEALTLDVVAKGGPAEWVTDALTLTAAPQAVPYRANMGPRALLEATAAYLGRLTKEGGDTWEGEWLDVKALDGGDGRYLLPGDAVRLKVEMASGEITRDVRVLELSYVDAVGRAPVEMRARFGRVLPGLYDAVQGTASRVTVETSGGGSAGSGVSLDVPPLAVVTASQPTNAEPGGADGVVVTVGVPTGSASGTSAHLSLVSADGESVRESATITVADFTAAAARGASTVPVRFSVDRGGPFDVRAVPVRHGVEGPPTVRVVDVDASAPGTTARSLPPVRGFRWTAGSQTDEGSWLLIEDARVAGVEVLVLSADTVADLRGPTDVVLARPGVTVARVLRGKDAGFVYRRPFARRNQVYDYRPVPVAAGTPAYLALTRPDLVATDAQGSYFLSPSGAPVVLPLTGADAASASADA